jgi:hypothetical protein
MKRITSFLLACIIIVGVSSGGIAVAVDDVEQVEIGFEPFSSDFLSSYGGSISRVSSGNLRVNFTVRATAIYSRVGASIISIQERNGNSWRTVAIFYSSTTSGMMGSNTIIHSGNINYAGTAGVEYRASITVFAGGTTGDQRNFVTNPVTA